MGSWPRQAHRTRASVVAEYMALVLWSTVAWSDALFLCSMCLIPMHNIAALQSGRQREHTQNNIINFQMAS